MPDNATNGGGGADGVSQDSGASGPQNGGGSRMVQVSEEELARLRNRDKSFTEVSTDMHKFKNSTRQWSELFGGRPFDEVATEIAKQDEERKKREQADMSAEERLKAVTGDFQKERESWASKENQYKTAIKERDEQLRNERLQNKLEGQLSQPNTRATSPQDAFTIMKSRGAVRLSDDGSQILFFNEDKTPMLMNDGNPVSLEVGVRRWLEANPHFAEAVFNGGSGMRTMRGHARTEEQITADLNDLQLKFQANKIGRDEYHKQLQALDEEWKAAGGSSEFDKNTVVSSR